MRSEDLKLALVVFGVLAIIVTTANYSYNVAHSQNSSNIRLGSMMVDVNGFAFSKVLGMRVSNPVNRDVHIALSVSSNMSAYDEFVSTSINGSTILPASVSNMILMFTFTVSENVSCRYLVTAWGSEI